MKTENINNKSTLFASSSSNGAFLRVLHVDDDPSLLEMFQLFMDKLDESIEVISCGNPLEALHLVAEDNIDCVVSDYVMKELNGIEFASRVKELKDIPFILYTGQGSEVVAERAFQAGADDYLRKEIEPSHYEVLLNRIRHVVDKYRAEQIYRVVFDSNPEAIIVTIDNTIEYSNHAAVALFSVDSELDLVGRQFTDFIADYDVNEMSWISLQRIISDNRIVPFELGLLCGSGNHRLVMGTVQNMYFFGKPAQFYFLRDITERREMEHGLMHTQYMFDRLMNHSLVGVAIIGADFEIRQCNKSFREHLGMKPETTSLKLLEKPEIFSKIHGRLLPSDSAFFDLTLDFRELRQNGYLDSGNQGVAKIEMVLSPVTLEDDCPGFLVQVKVKNPA